MLKHVRAIVAAFARRFTVAKYMVRRGGRPSPTWRSFLRNQAAGIAAIDMFVVASASFRPLYVMIIQAHDRRKILRFDDHAALRQGEGQKCADGKQLPFGYAAMV